MPWLKPVAGALKRVPWVDGALQHHRWAHFVSARGYASSFGVFRSFDEARRKAPPSREFDQPELADEYRDRLTTVFPYDYPVVLWLERALSSGCRRILDVGGNIGVHYFAYQHLLAYPADLVWTVCEVQAIAEAGRRLAAARGARGLRFASPLTAGLVEEADVLLSAGALQYIERPQLHELLGPARRRPRHLLLNKLPIYDGEAFVSLQNIRRGFAPHYVYERRSFTEPLLALGYTVLDAWDVPERSFWLPGRPERSFRAYSGLYLTRAG